MNKDAIILGLRYNVDRLESLLREGEDVLMDNWDEMKRLMVNILLMVHALDIRITDLGLDEDNLELESYVPIHMKVKEYLRSVE